MKKGIKQNTIKKSIKVLIAVLALFLFNIDVKAVSITSFYNYTGNVQEFTAPYTGLYKLETWGAQGGKGDQGSTVNLGGYSTGLINLEQGEKLYVVVGGMPSSSAGGYNGGGTADSSVRAGGGATHISTSTGLLRNLGSNLDSVIIVSGGGGGSDSSPGGGAGGGFVGNKGANYSSSLTGGSGGTQTGAGTSGGFGYGGGAISSNGDYGGAGGGGFYGGGRSTPSAGSGGGGSGYIANTKLESNENYIKHMTCYNCQISNDDNTRTLSTTNYSSAPKPEYAKAGNGYAKITYIGSTFNEGDSIDYDHIEDFQTFTAPYIGDYKIELWGAKGSKVNNGNSNGGNGAYTSGTIHLNKNEEIYIYVGGYGNGYNAGYKGNYNAEPTGGGSTDVRLVSGEWNNTQSLASRIMVAAGGGGGGWDGPGGIAGGLNGTGAASYQTGWSGKGATQTSGGVGGNNNASLSGSFGMNGRPNIAASGGGGYYGGGSGHGQNDFAHGAGGGGSSYISGYTGCVAINGENDITPKAGCANGTTDIECSYHYSGKVFDDSVMIAGNQSMPTQNGLSTMTGNTGAGYAKITFLRPSTGLGNFDVKVGSVYEEFNLSRTNYTWIIPKGVNKLYKDDIIAPTINPEATVVIPESVDFTQDGDSFQIVTTEPDGETITNYTITMQRYVSNDARLKNLSSDIGKLNKNFDKDTDNYILEISGDADKVSLSAEVNEQDATIIEGVGEIDLEGDETHHTITVQAEDGTINVYTVEIRKNLFLEDLGLRGFDDCECEEGFCELTPEFDPEVREYSINVPSDYIDLDVFYDKSPTQTVKLKIGNDYITTYQLVTGLTVVNVEVYNSNNTLVNTYKINVIKINGSLVTLDDIIVKKGKIVEKIKRSKTNYTWIIPKGTTEITKNDLTAIPTFSASVVTLPDRIPYTQDGDTYEIEVNVKKENTFNYKGTAQEFIVPYTGDYQIELWGAKGSQVNFGRSNGGNGAYTSGRMHLYKNEKYYLYIGGYGNGYNAGYKGNYNIEPTGGGATDIRLVSGEWNNTQSLASRIMVAAGGGAGGWDGPGGIAGGLNGTGAASYQTGWSGKGATQTSGGAGGNNNGSLSGSFGVNGRPNIAASGGGGYYGGGSGHGQNQFAHGAGGGGSSYISGYTGSVAIKGENDITPKAGCANGTTDVTCSYHYSGKVFTDPVMKAGNQSMPNYNGTGTMTGNGSSGFAKITLLDAEGLDTTVTYTLTLKRSLSDDARLGSLTTDKGRFTEEFDKDKDEYVLEMFIRDRNVTFDATAFEPDANVIDGLGEVRLTEDETYHNITVQAEDGTIKVYTIIIRRNMYLEELGLDGLEGLYCRAGECELTPAFTPEVTNYDIKVPINYNILDAYYVPASADHASMMTINDEPYVDNYELPLQGTTVVKVHIYNDNNEVVKTYTMNVIKEVNDVYTYEYTGDYQVFIAPYTGKYKFETWGASGANMDSSNGSFTGGTGAYTSGYLDLNKDDILYVYVGAQGGNEATNKTYGEYSFNGASGGNYACYDSYSGSTSHNFYGGAATDIRLKVGAWDDEESLASRIMVSAGGASANGNANGVYAGALNGVSGTQGTGGSQVAAGGPNSGEFGKAGIPTYSGELCLSNTANGAGSGYYGGGAYNRSLANNGMGSAGSGSSYISGYIGSVAIKAEDDITPKDGCETGTNDVECSYHYSGKVFTSPMMKAGNKPMPTHDGTGIMTGNTGDGFAKITYIPENPKRTRFDYTGDYQTYVAPYKGTYRMETWGAKGANMASSSGNYDGGAGAYASGTIELNKGDTLYVYVGEEGIYKNVDVPYGELSFNGGSGGNFACYDYYSGTTAHNYYGGAASDIRLVSGNWDNTTSLASRIMVAAGGAAANGKANGTVGGTLNGVSGAQGTGATQKTAGGPTAGDFGKAAVPMYSGELCSSNTAGGAGSGYYGGGAYNRSVANNGLGSAGSGSSYISGHTGSIAIKAEDDITPKTGCNNGTTNIECSYHYSEKIFTDTIMKAGNEIIPSEDGVTTKIGNEDAGHAAITLMEVDVKLESLEVKKGYLTEDFDKNINTYTWMIPRGVDALTNEDVEAVLSNPDATLTIPELVPFLNDGDLFEIIVTGDDGETTNTYTLVMVRDKSSDARLKSLESDVGNLNKEFDPDDNEYIISIYDYVNSITLDAETMDEEAVIVSGIGTLYFDDDIIENQIVVTAEDGTTNVYNVLIKKDAYLLYLGLNGLDGLPCVGDECMLVPPYEPQSNEYSIKVPYEYETLDVFYLTVNPEHTVKIKVNDTEVNNYSLPEGETEVSIELYSKNNVLLNTYTMNVNRQKGDDATLENLEVSIGELDVPFYREIFEYTWILPDDVSTNLEDYISYTTTDPGATVEIIPSSISYTGEGSKFEIVVTAEDGVTTNTYTINLQQDIIEDIEVEENMLLTVGETKNLYINGLPEGSVGKYLYEVDQNAIILVDDYGDVYGVIPGTATITISVKNHPEIDSKVVHVTVISDKLESDIYDVREADPDNNKDRIVVGAEPLTTISDYKDNMLNPNEYLHVYDSEGNELDDDSTVKTGLVIKLEIDGIVHDEAYIVIRGDVNKDGFVNMADYMIMQNHYLEMEEITEYVSYAAADVAEDEIINMQDTMKLLNYYTEQIDTLNE